MKNNHKLTLSVFILLLSTSLLATNTLDQARIYINPGHGGWGANDRPLATINHAMLDTLGFFETNTNLWKALSLKNELEKAEAGYIRISRTKNGIAPASQSTLNQYEVYEGNGQIVTLSAIARDVEENNMDYFISIHSNATTEGATTNFPLLLFRGTDNEVGNGLIHAKDMCVDAWKYIVKNDITYHSAYKTSSNIRGDHTFYGSTSEFNGYIGYLGVLKHGCDGYLCEGCFHTYQPERHRLLNLDYCKQEGVRYSRAIRAWFGDNTETKGYIMGTVKDKYESLDNALYNYKIASVDEYRPLNNVNVVLQDNTGATIATYTTDNEYNGIYVFSDLTPGNYKLHYNIDGYWEETEDIEVVANETSFINKRMTNLLKPKPGSEDNEVKEVAAYPHPEQDGDIAGASWYNFIKETELPNLSDLTDLTIRRAILHDGKYYVLAVDANKNPKLFALDAETGTLVKEMNTTSNVVTTGYNGKSYPYILSDIAFTNDSVLLGFNSTVIGKTNNSYQTGDFHMYKWEASDGVALEDATPEIFLTLTTNNSTNHLIAGYNNSNLMANSGVVNGNLDDFMFYFDSHAGSDWTTTYGIRYVVWRIKNGQIIGYQYNTSPWNETQMGEDVRMTLSPLELDHVIIDGNSMKPKHFLIETASTEISNIVEFNEDISLASTGSTYFRYADKVYMSAPVCEEQANNSYSYKSYLYDITNGFNKAVNVGTTETYITESNVQYMTSTATVDNADINQYLLVGTKAVKYTTKGIEQISGTARIFAYDLTAEYNENANGYEISFTLNDDATAVELILTELNTNEEIKSVALGSLTKGTHQTVLSNNDIPDTGRFHWGIRAKANNITRFTKISDDSKLYQYFAPKGIAIDKSPESTYFGRIYISNTAAGTFNERSTTTGIYVLDPMGSDITSQGDVAHAGSISWTGSNDESPRKVAVAIDGRIFIADASTTNAGIYYMNPETFDVSPIFTGATNSNGALKIGGTYVCGQIVAIGTRGSGLETQLYAVDKKASGSNWKKFVNVYNIGEATTWTNAPNYSAAASSYIGNDNSSIAPVSTGYWGGQYRGPGSNTTANPCMFYYSDVRGEVVFNTAEAEFTLPLSSQNGGLAVNEAEGLVVLSYDGGVYVFKYNLNNEDIPIVTPKYQHSLGVSSVTYDDFEFDYAGNLYAVSYSGKFVSVWAMPTGNNVCTTPAKKASTIVRYGQDIPSVGNLSAQKEFNKITLTWTEPVGAGMDVLAYAVYKNNELIDTITETSYIDEGVDNAMYEYAIVVLYEGDIESPKVSLSVKMDIVMANIYASSLNFTKNDTQYKFNFVLNENAKEVFIEITNENTILKSYNAGAMNKGENTYYVNLADIPSGTNMHWQVRAVAPNISEPTKISDESQVQMQFYGPRGLAVDNNPENPNFGRIYVSESQGGTVTQRTTQNGIYILDPLFTDITNQGANAYVGGQTWSATSSPFRICTAPDGRLFIADWSDEHSGVYIMDTENPSADFIPVFGGERQESGLLVNNGVNIGGSAPHCCVLGAGTETKLYVFDEDYLSDVATKGNNLLQYNIGEATLPWNEAPSSIVYNDATNGGIMLNGNSSIAPDGKGGWWISQYRASDEASVPSLIHVNTSGLVDFNSGNTPTLLESTYTGGMAVSSDFKKLAIGTTRKTLKIFEITFDGSNIPDLSLLYTISTPGNNTAGLAFDVADNVYLVSNSSERLSAWSLPKENNTYTTPAPTSQLINNDIPEGVSNLTAAVDFNKVTLTWTAPQGDTNIEKYKVYRDDVWMQDVSETTFVEENLNNGTYVYTVVPVYIGMLEGLPASQSTTIDMHCGPVRDLQASVSDNSVTLTWEQPEGISAISTYNVYRDNVLLENVAEKTFTESDCNDGEYVYSVTALFGDYETEKANINISITTGIDLLNANFAIYPNPTEGIITIESTESIHTIQVFNLEGRMLMDIQELNSNKHKVDLSTLKAGVYLVRVNDNAVSQIIKK